MALDTENTGEQAQQAPDRREILSEQFEALEKPENVSRETTVERARDETGKFAAKEPSGKTKAPAVQESAEAAGANSGVEEPLWKRPPASWKKEFHDTWKSADPRLQEYAYQREEQMRAGVEPLLPKAQLADRITEVSAPYMNIINGLGVDLPTAVGALMKADQQLRTLPPAERMQYLATLARGYGLDLSAALGQAPQPGQQAIDPNYYALQNELVSMKGEISSWKQQQEQTQNAQALAEINAFAPTVEHFEEARPTMIELLDKGFAKSIPEAYQKAIRLNDELFEAEQQRTQTQNAQAQIVAKNTQAQRAKTAAVSLKGTTPGARTTTKAQTRREMIAEQLDSLDSRL